MPTDRNYITVAELNYYVNRVFEAEELLHNVPVVGEVSGCSVVKNNCYFTLKDEKAQIKVVYFNVSSKFVPSNGEKVLVRGTVDYYQAGGQINVKAYEITRFGMGAMYAKLEALKASLASEGIFDESHKKPIPKYPVNIGLITSTKGAAMQDFFRTIGLNDSKQNITVIDVRVQGDYCVSDVVCALTYADAYGFDVIILARGGGSFEDLFPFNDESIVRTIYSMKTPLISAIGHETDYTLCDFVSDYRAITPTAAAEKVAVSDKEMRDKIAELLGEVKQLTIEKYKSEVENLSDIISDISDAANGLLKEKYKTIGFLLQTAKIRTGHLFDINARKTSEYINLLENLNPLKLLSKGYFRILHDKKVVTDFSSIDENSEIVVIGQKEKITATVTKKESVCLTTNQ